MLSCFLRFLLVVLGSKLHISCIYVPVHVAVSNTTTRYFESLNCVISYAHTQQLRQKRQLVCTSITITFPTANAPFEIEKASFQTLTNRRKCLRFVHGRKLLSTRIADKADYCMWVRLEDEQSLLSQCHDFLSTHEPISLFCTLSPIFSFLTVLRILQVIYMLGRICLSAYS